MCFSAGTLRGLLSITYSCLSFIILTSLWEMGITVPVLEMKIEILRGEVTSQLITSLGFWSSSGWREMICPVLQSLFLGALLWCHEVTETVPLIKWTEKRPRTVGRRITMQIYLLKKVSFFVFNLVILIEEWWWTGKPGVLRFMVAKSRTQLSNWTELKIT